jgi:hypothetical protein
MSDFDPAAHRMVDQQRWFEDFVLGERFVIPSRTMTSAVFAAFQAASDDTHPVCRAARLDENRHGETFTNSIDCLPGAAADGPRPSW